MHTCSPGHPHPCCATLWQCRCIACLLHRVVYTLHPLPTSYATATLLCHQVVVCLYFFIAISGCLLGIKRFEGALLLLPLAGAVLAFHVLVWALAGRGRDVCVAGGEDCQVCHVRWQVHACVTVAF
jgi:hypothetical protein